MKKIVVGSDHAGLRMKNCLVEDLKQWGYEVEDVGCFSEESTDYPLIADELAKRFLAGNYDWGLLCCGSGVGVCMAANRYPYIRAVRAHDTVTARMSRLHNDANVLCMGGRFIAPELAAEILKTWLGTDFEGDRHQRRVDQMGKLNNSEVSQTC